MLVKDIFSEVRINLQDSAPANLQAGDVWSPRWSDDALVSAYNNARWWMVQVRPDTSAVIVEHHCLNRARQNRPAGVYRIMDGVENINSGRTIRSSTREVLSGLDPNWSTVTGNDVEFVVVDERTPDVFWLHPVVPAGHAVDLQVSKIPLQNTLAEIHHASNPAALDLSDVYSPTVVLAMMYWVYMQDGETEANMLQAQTYLKMAANNLDISWQIALMYTQPVEGDNGKP